jgi:hypothetical protein
MRRLLRRHVRVRFQRNGRIKPILREIIAWQDANGYPPSFATEVSAGARCATAIPT